MIRRRRANGCSEHEYLAEVGLAPLSQEHRERPVPLLKVFELFRMLAAQEGPDACARMVSPSSLEDLGVLGSLILGAHTPREALTRTEHFLPRYSTHEIIVLRPIPGGLRLQAGWSLHMDQEIAHLTQQFTAALVFHLCLATRQPFASPKNMRIRSHPEAGVDHLCKIFGDDVAASDDAVLSLDLDDRILDAPLPFNSANGLDTPPAEWVIPHGDGSFGPSVRLALDALSAEPPPRVDQIAELAGLSVRSLQRLLTSEGTSFRSLLDNSRRARTLEGLQDWNGPRVGSGELGFSGQSALARAVRRWTGMSPRRLRRGDLPLGDAETDVRV
jgi:AraC-like DNA-binding protein